MATPTEITQTQPNTGLVQRVYNFTKSYLPTVDNNQFVTDVDLKITQLAKTCDQLVLSTSNTLKAVVDKIPPTSKVTGYLIQSSEHSIQRLEQFLNSAIELLGGKLSEAKAESEDAASRLVNIIAKVVEVNSLLVKNTTNQIIEYVQSPGTLVVDVKTQANKLYIEVSAISIALRQLVKDTFEEVLGGLNARFTETRKKVKVLLVQIENPEKAYNLLSERIVDAKNVTVKRVGQGIEIAIDRKHYAQNFKKLAGSILQVFQSVREKADVVIESSTSYTKELYEKTVKNYKIQKILLSSPKQESS